MVLGIFSTLSEYDREKTRAGQIWAATKGKHTGRPKGINVEQFGKVKKAMERGLSVNETVNLTGISISSIKRYRKQLQAMTEMKI